jgi:hypothetical protein
MRGLWIRARIEDIEKEGKKERARKIVDNL